jgi:hypothetical protein
MTTYLHPEVYYESSSITHFSRCHLVMATPDRMTSNPFIFPIEKLTILIIRLVSYLVYLALLLTTGLIWLIRFILQRTGFWALAEALWARTPVILKRKWDDRQYKRRERNKRKTEDILQDESLARGRKERAQIEEAMVKVGWKRSVGKMDFGIDMKEEEGRKRAGRIWEEGVWIEDEVVPQDEDLLQTLEDRADFGKKAGIRDQIGLSQGKTTRRNRDTEDFPEF